MKVSVLGCGRWATFLAWYSHKINHDVTIWGREASQNYRELYETRKNTYLEIPYDIKLTNDLEHAIENAEVIIVSISAQNLRDLASKISEINIENKVFVLCMKGIESSTGKRLTQVFKEAIGKPVKVGIWVGPGHVQDFTKEIPNCMVVDSEDIEVTKYIVKCFNGKLIRFYYGEDLIGNEIGAAAKNVVGIAAGMLDGANLGSLKGALMARGTREFSRLIEGMGGNKITAYGLSHLGDYEATLFSQNSNNRMFGEKYIKGDKFDKLAEGVYTIKALVDLSKEYNVELPISSALYSIIYEEKDAREVLEELFLRSLKYEF